MAYSNWGAWVFRNGEPRHDREDVAVYNDAEKDTPAALSIWANIYRLREEYGEGNAPAWEHAYHAVLGDSFVRLCGYKNWGHLFIAWPEREVEHIDLDSYEMQSGVVDMGEFGQWKWATEPIDSKVDLSLIEPDGTEWTSRCGYMYGAGFG